MDDPNGPQRTLYVGNLDLAVTEELLFMLFSQFGVCLECKILREVGHDPYAFVKYMDHQSAQAALLAMNKISVLGRELKVNWASHPGTVVKQDTSNHFHIYVGDLSPDIDVPQIKNAFSPFGEISDCKIIRDPHTQMSKGYAFVCFVKKEDAENAIVTMNGQWLGGRTIKTNWASGKGNNIPLNKFSGRTILDYDEVYNQTSATNVTVYIAGVQSGLNEELLRETFSCYGNIIDIRIFKEKGYAFVRMDSKESACHGIVGVHGSEINGFPVKCSWGKDPNDVQQASKPPTLTPAFTPPAISAAAGLPAAVNNQPYNPFYHQMNYWMNSNNNFMNPYQQPPPHALHSQPHHNIYPYQAYLGNQWPANGGAGDAQ